MTYNAEKLVPFADRNATKNEQIEYMFDEIAPKYDRMNHLMSFGIDKVWRKKGLLKLKEFKPQTILDVATGTGDLAIKAFKLLKPKLILGIDISEGMMEIGKQKVAKEGLSEFIKFEWQDCSELQLEPESFDAVMMAFGIRNFANPDKALQNILRVMRSGGKLMILELSTPEYFPMKQAYAVYSRYFIPALGHKLAKNQNAYKYLPKSITAFPQNEALKIILEKNGFHSVKYQKLFPGVCTLYFATK
jgi:ubiquinone/menaquinone biosynthesis methyltransferases